MRSVVRALFCNGEGSGKVIWKLYPGPYSAMVREVEK